MQSSKKSSTFAVGFEVICLINQVFLAQLVEQLTLNQWVEGSSPSEDTKDIRKGVFFLCPSCGTRTLYWAPKTFYVLGKVRNNRVSFLRSKNIRRNYLERRVPGSTPKTSVRVSFFCVPPAG